MIDTKRQDLPGILWVVATPIGNLGDLSVRAKEVLAGADVVLCEDTRRTSRLCAATGISPRLERLDAHADDHRLQTMVDRLAGGQRAALVTDAGTPGVSDPAAALVALARSRGVEVVPIPGPSAVVTLLSVSGFVESSFAFGGFFPRKDGDRKRTIEAAARFAEICRIMVWFESPERIEDSLGLLARLVPDARVVAAKELTKMHERVFAGTAGETAQAVAEELEREGRLGEWCFACRFPEVTESPETGLETSSGDSAGWRLALRCLLESGVALNEAAKRVSQYFAVPKNAVYEEGLRLSGKK